MGSILLICTVVVAVCIVVSRLSRRLGTPALLLFLALGMLFDSNELFCTPSDNSEAAERICSVALIFIMFYGGFSTRWEAARPAVAQAVVLSTLGVAVTALLTALSCHSALSFSVLKNFLTGAVISSTDTASVLSILRSKKLGPRSHTASLLEVESGSDDPALYMLTVIALSLMGVGGGETIPWMIFTQVVFGSGLGAAVTELFILAFHRLTFSDGLDTIFVVTAVLFSFTLPAVVGGNGYLGAYLAGILVGDARIPRKAALVHFLDGPTSLAQILIFFLLRLFSSPWQLPTVFLPALTTMAFPTFVARPAAVFLLLALFRCGVWQCLLMFQAGLRGTASIVFAIVTVANEAVISHDLFHIVFCIVLPSVAAQGSLLPLAVRKLDMMDSAESVSRTFNGYQDQRQLHLTRFPIDADHLWVGWTTGEYELPTDALVVVFRRDSKNMIPNGDTAIQAGNLMVSGTPLYEDDDGVNLRKVPVAEHGDWVGRPVKELGIPVEILIVLVCRIDGITVVPKGGMIFQQGDMLVVNEWEEA